MAWIDTKGLEEAEGELKEHFRRVTDPQTGELDNIMSIHSAHPPGLGAHFELYKAVMRGTPTLRKLEREMIGVVVSVENGCHY